MSIPLWAGARRLIDDAAVFPPGNLPLAQAVRAHADHRADRLLSAVVGPFVVKAADLTEALAHVAPGAGPLDISAIVVGPAGLHAALEDWGLDPRVRIAAVEVAATVDTDAIAELDLIAEVVADERGRCRLGPTTTVFVEVGWDALAGVGAASVARAARQLGLCLKLRTGGVVASAFPSEALLASVLQALVANGTPFKCTAGLHHAIRHRDAATGFEHHGFLNILAATLAARSAVDLRPVAAAIAEQDDGTVVDVLSKATEPELLRARSVFRSYGSCSISEPVDQLARLGFLPGSEAA